MKIGNRRFIVLAVITRMGAKIDDACTYGARLKTSQEMRWGRLDNLTEKIKNRCGNPDIRQ